MVPVLEADAARLLPRLFRVGRVSRELHDAWTLELEPAEADASLAFRPGQFAMVYCFGVGEVALSISGDPARTGTLVHTVRAVGAVTRAICASRKGDTLGIRGPYGEGWPVGKAEGGDVVIVAGGIGLAPLRPAIHAILSRRRAFGRVALLVGARMPKDLLYPRMLERWRSRFDLEVRPTVDAADREWKGEVGVVTTLIPRAMFDPAKTTAFVCGPEVMMRFTATALLDRGVPPESIFLSMERNMKCAVGVCGHCQFGPAFICKDGPVLPYSRLKDLMRIREI
jgi:NAD(P)H-flavin reductase